MLDGPGGRLHGGRAERRLAVRREDHAMHAGGFRASQQRPDVLGILEGIEGEYERRLRPLDAPGEDLVEGSEPARTDHKGDPLVTVESGHGCKRAALNLDDRNSQARGMQDETLERLASLGDDQQPNCGSPRDECLLDRAAAGDELLAVAEQVVGWRRGTSILELRGDMPAGWTCPRRARIRPRTRAGIGRARARKRRTRARRPGASGSRASRSRARRPGASGSVEGRSILTVERRPTRAVEGRSVRTVERWPTRTTTLERPTIALDRSSGLTLPVALESPARLGAIIRCPPVGGPIRFAAWPAAGSEAARTLTSRPARRSSSLTAGSALPPRRTVAGTGAAPIAAAWPGRRTAGAGSG